MKTRSASFASLALLLQSGLVHAVALSDMEVRSRLNQPLDAQVRLLSATKSELDSLQIKVVSAAVAGAYVEFQSEVVQDDQGPVIRITTEDSVREPILMLQVEMSWSTGHLTREYSLIIDPR
jgi:pilus assembly protein FimV